MMEKHKFSPLLFHVDLILIGLCGTDWGEVLYRGLGLLPMCLFHSGSLGNELPSENGPGRFNLVFNYFTQDLWTWMTWLKGS